MTVAELQTICHIHPGVTEDIKWESHLCFCVGEKMFLVTSRNSFPVAAAFKATKAEFEHLLGQEGFSAHQYLGRHHWVQLDDIRRLSATQWQQYIGGSYRLIAAKLPGKVRRQLAS